MANIRYILSDELKKKRFRLPAGAVLALGFVALIALGSFLLFLPIANTFPQHGPSEYFDCLFTSVSCVCVTGLSTVTVVTTFTLFGQAVMLILIQIGGLGFMTAAVLLSRILRRRITPREQIIAAQACGVDVGVDVRKVINDVIRRTAIIEGVGALLLTAQMWRYTDGFFTSLWYSLFHSVSAFCNAGFDLFNFESGSLTGLSQNPYILIILMILIAVGGIGFVVWDDVLCRLRDHTDKLSVYTKFIFIVSASLFLFSSVYTFLIERNNPETLGSMNLFDQIVNSCFHGVTLRTAGFATFHNGGMSDAEKLMSCVMMFIGGCSGSTAGGIKVGTIGIIVFAVFRFSFGRKNLNVWHRKIDQQVFMRAVSLFFIGLFVVLVSTGVFSAIEGKPVIDLFYEVASAFGTVGLSTGLTPTLTFATKTLLLFLMYFGRVGVLTVTTSFTAKSTENDYGMQYPTTAFYVG